MRFQLIHYIDESVIRWDDNGHGLPDAEADREMAAWDDEMTDRGILTGGGRLRPARQTTTLRVRDGELIVTDGPYAETKEQMAGYCVLDCASLAEAIEVAARHPTARIGTFELRPFLDDDDAPAPG